jgi:hypothetical protein
MQSPRQRCFSTVRDTHKPNLSGPVLRRSQFTRRSSMRTAKTTVGKTGYASLRHEQRLGSCLQEVSWMNEKARGRRRRVTTVTSALADLLGNASRPDRARASSFFSLRAVRLFQRRVTPVPTVSDLLLDAFGNPFLLEEAPDTSGVSTQNSAIPACFYRFAGAIRFGSLTDVSRPRFIAG